MGVGERQTRLEEIFHFKNIFPVPVLVHEPLFGKEAAVEPTATSGV